MVESLPRNGFPKDQENLFAFLAEHLIRQKKHFNIGFDPEKFPEVGKIIEKIRISA
jgi:hypothetical protein